jgi:hypothetical protein
VPNSDTTPLKTISENGAPPDSRLTEAKYAYEIVNELIDANEKRAKVDTKVFGLVSGHPPFRQSELVAQAQAWRCNINWRIAESFLSLALTAYWDVIAEAPSYASVHVESDNPDESEEWSGIASEEFDRLNRRDTELNFMFRRNHHDMVLYRCGPAMFQDTLSFKAKPVSCGNLLVPDQTQSCTNEWSMAVVRTEYRVDELYGFIRNPKAASMAGWKTGAVRKALMNAAPASMWPRNRRNDWEWFAQHVRNNDYYFSTISDSVPCAHLLFKEFPKDGEASGRITQCIVLESEESDEFLFRKERRFGSWQQIIHPFYYDTGDGTHHSVKGLGIKAYGALETFNRLTCHGVDAAKWSSSMHFQATDSTALEALSVTTMGPYIWHNPGGTFIQQQMGQNMDGLMAMKQDLLNTVTSNLAQYRQSLQKTQGNPRTAREVSLDAVNQSVIGKSGMTWYFEQLDDFWKERHRRVMNPNLTVIHGDYAEAMMYRDRCVKRGVPVNELRRAEVRATRTVGYGSADERLQAMGRLLSRIPLYDEDGRRKILEDITKMDVGPALAKRYIRPDAAPSREMQEQAAEAQQNVAVMKTGLEPMVTPSQNPVVFAQVYLVAASQALASIPQGGNPMEIFGFLQIAGMSIGKQLQRMAQDPSRKEAFQALEKQWIELGKQTAQLQQTIQQQQQQAKKQQAQVQQRQSEMMTSGRLDEIELQNKLRMQQEKTDAMIRLKEQKQAQSLSLSDASTASNIRLKAQQAEADAAIKMKRSESAGAE